MSGQGEADFDKCLSVNLDGTKNLLEASRALLQQGHSGGAPVRFVFPSSFAAFGPAVEVDDDTRLAPQSTYGTTKAIAEMLINDFTRKGWVDGRTGRLPTVVVRPGSANGAATGCFSGVVRELLMGNNFEIPVSPSQRHPVISTRRTIKGLLALAELAPEALGHDRCVGLRWGWMAWDWGVGSVPSLCLLAGSGWLACPDGSTCRPSNRLIHSLHNT